jgi:hypothetical protein
LLGRCGFFGVGGVEGQNYEGYFVSLVFASTIYNIWRNHNALKHNNNPCTEEKLIQRIRWEVRTRFTTKGRFKKTRGNDILCNAWGIDGTLV